jgi:hypothetical protein
MSYPYFVVLLLISFTLQSNASAMEALAGAGESKSRERRALLPSSAALYRYTQARSDIDADETDTIPERRCTNPSKVGIDVTFHSNSDIPEWLAHAHGTFSLALRYGGSVHYEEDLILEGRLHPSIQVLTLDGCNLREIPEAIKHMPSLKKLIIKNNPGLRIPEGSLPESLRFFNLINCGLRTVPPTLRTMEFLASISLHGNPGIAIKLGDLPSSLQELQLCHCDWTAERFAPIAETLPHLRTVTY